MNIANAKNFKPELLSPAGNYEGFLACIKAGADAVYLGGRKYGARAFADNFSDEEILRAIKYAHLFDVKVYLTVNTLIKEREFEDCIEYLKPFADAGIDAFIVQDLGLMQAVKKNFPNIDLHVSTQAFCESAYSFELFKELGASRIVPARELSLEEIKEIKKSSDLEIETFIHGAMCYSYSGQCLFSSTLGGRSGNRGRCAGPCRQPYTPFFDGKTYSEQYILSMKDQCTVQILDKLIEAGIDSFKIEGRMKSAEYTAFVTSIYRKYIDRYFADKDNYSVDKKDIEKLNTVFIRTKIGTGYYLTHSSKDMITIDNPAYASKDDHLIKEIKEKYIDNPKKAPISGYCYIKVGEPMMLSLTYKDKSITAMGPIAEKSIKSATTEESVNKQLSKLGDTPFVFENLTIDSDSDAFVPVSVINDLRRRAAEELLNEL
jgi:putative protease